MSILNRIYSEFEIGSIMTNQPIVQAGSLNVFLVVRESFWRSYQADLLKDLSFTCTDPNDFEWPLSVSKPWHFCMSLLASPQVFGFAEIFGWWFSSEENPKNQCATFFLLWILSLNPVRGYSSKENERKRICRLFPIFGWQKSFWTDWKSQSLKFDDQTFHLIYLFCKRFFKEDAIVIAFPQRVTNRSRYKAL